MAKKLVKWVVPLVLGFLVFFFVNHAGLPLKSAQFAGVFIAVIFGLIFQPVPGEQIVFLGVILSAVSGLISIEKALSGYGDPIVWLVLSAVMLSRGMIKTGLGKRLAFLLIWALGKRTLTLGYALVGADYLMGAVMPSNGARAGAILFPIVKSLSETYDSRPGPTAKRLGAFLMTLVYQGDVIVCASFLTGQISNFLIVKFIQQSTGIQISFLDWFIAGCVPSLLTLLLMPLLLYKFYTPEVKVTPLAPKMAQEELKKLGPMGRQEKMTLAIFLFMAGLWMTSSIHHIHFTLVALVGIVLMLQTRIIEWTDIIQEKTAWNVYIWFGGLIMLAGCLQEFGITKELADVTVSLVSGASAWTTLSFLVLVYFFAHYFFASVTAHVTAMFIPFLSVALASGAPTHVVALMFAFFSNLCAGLTHYGTTPAPIYFGAGYVSQGEWWKVGFFAALLSIVIWVVVGLSWWKVLGYW